MTITYYTKEGKFETLSDDDSVPYDKLHRTNGPAIISSNGDKAWLINGKQHRLDGPAIEWKDGTKHWLINGTHHRLNGPAIDHIDGTKKWYVKGKLHRLDGPAVIWFDEEEEYWINGIELNYIDYKQVIDNYDFNKKNDILMFMLKFG